MEDVHAGQSVVSGAALLVCGNCLCRLVRRVCRRIKAIGDAGLALGGSDGVGGALRATLASSGDNVQGGAIGPNCGHFLPEECPDELTDAIFKFREASAMK